MSDTDEHETPRQARSGRDRRTGSFNFFARVDSIHKGWWYFGVALAVGSAGWQFMAPVVVAKQMEPIIRTEVAPITERMDSLESQMHRDAQHESTDHMAVVRRMDAADSARAIRGDEIRTIVRALGRLSCLDKPRDSREAGVPCASLLDGNSLPTTR